MNIDIPGAGNDDGSGDAYLRDLYEHAPCGYLTTRPNGLILRANSTFLAWTGYRSNELVGRKRFQDLLPAGTRVFHDTYFEPLLHMNGYAKELAFDLNCANGQRLPTLLNSRLIRDDTGAPQLILTTLLDARQRRSYEEELLNARRKAEASEARVHQLNARLEELVAIRTDERDRLWRISKDILAIATVEGRFVSVNQAFCSIFEWTAEEAEGMPIENIVPPEERAEMQRNIAQLQNGLEIIGIEVRRKKKHGGIVWISWNIVAKDGMLYMVGRDVTEQRQQRLLLEQAEDALRQASKMEAVGQLTGGIAHDFNNLLAGMVGNLQLMRIRLQQGRLEDVARHINAAETVSERATSMIHRLLAFSRKQTLQPKPTDVNERILFMQELIERTVGPAIAVNVRLNTNILPALCDANQLETALLNLAINARDAMPEGGDLGMTSDEIWLHDQLEAHAIGLTAGAYIVVSMSDTGSGMSTEVLERAFDPFFTTKPIGQGTGLGLSMVYGFARQSCGQVRIESVLDAGTTVKIFLPASAEKVGQSAQSAAPSPVTRPTMNASVVLVDDEAPLRILLAEVLGEAGYHVYQAEDAVVAMEILSGLQQVDVLITDVGLGGTMNGKQLAEIARGQRPNIQVMFITGYPDKAVEGTRLLETGFEIMFKPFSLKEFSERVNQLAARE